MICNVVLFVNIFKEYCESYYENDYYYIVIDKDTLIYSYLLEEKAQIEVSFIKYDFLLEVIRNKNTIEKYEKYLKIDHNKNHILFKIQLLKEK